MTERHHQQQHGEIDWGAVFDGLSHATGTGNHLAPDAGAQSVTRGNAADNLNNLEHGAVWDHLFPPPQPAPRLDIGAALISQSADSTPRSVEAGPSRPRNQHRSYTYSASAPLTPNPAYAAGEDQDQFFAHLAGSILASQRPAGDGERVQDRAGLPSVPLPQGHNLQSLDLAPFGSRKSRTDNLPEWHTPDPSSSAFAFTLPPPHPSLAPHAMAHLRRQSTPVWPDHSTAGPSHHVYPPNREAPSPDLTPLVPPPGTPIQAVSTESSAGSLDTEDKRQRNTLASAKFRAKRKKHITNISKRIGELEGEHTSLTRDVADLRQENKFLREMVELKYGLDVGQGRGEGPEPDSPDDPDIRQG